jgi:hypothetical protein
MKQDPIKVSKADPEYRGRSIKLVIQDYVCVTDLIWGGGTRSVYRAVNLADLRASRDTRFLPFPEVTRMEGTYPVPDMVAIVEHTIFCGKDLGLRIYINPANVAPGMLPAAQAL